MRLPFALLASVAAFLSLSPASGHEGHGDHAAAPTPSSLGWLVGDWCGSQGKDGLQESWRLHGDTLLGMAGTVREGKLRSFEFTRIEMGKEGLQFVAQPGGSAPTIFRLTSQAAQRVDFANPAHDFPQSVSYWRDGDKLRAEIAGPGKNGEMRIPFEYVACPRG
ncbi:DUF6265 family protein [Arenimonas sp.]|uniref:DUF6265 family protein n=1 Tax=Arenimonas sp. TaxID=1872635 RepID=UPI0039E339AA